MLATENCKHLFYFVHSPVVYLSQRAITPSRARLEWLANADYNGE